MYVGGATFKSWTQGDLARVEEFLTEEIADPVHHARAFAQRSLVRSRLGRWDMATEDAKKVFLHPLSSMPY